MIPFLENMNPKLSILTPTIRGRESQLAKLQNKIEAQNRGEVEHLTLCDNRAMTIGEKRQSLVDIARGEYIAFVDDDDDISDDYVAEILAVLPAAPDVVTFKQDCICDGAQSTIVFRLGIADETFKPNGETMRDAWHVCAWRRETVKGCQFLFCNYGEDLAWAKQARTRAKTEVHIDKVLHHYRHSKETTAAPMS
jgi:glycosyltransferase involved in cell wall biosynthesis